MNGPDPADIWEEVEAWLRIAHNAARAVETCLAADPPLHDIGAYHCQQAAEKVLKGFLVRASIDFGKTHDLGKLGLTLAARFPSISVHVAVMGRWTNWGVA